ncbi:hypothetical protein QYW95_004593 [Escherichia coli]|uniref:hypothetical protein n=1 Tax=Escherichia coli TaxID=562 RepID=UPI000BE4EB5C|nr:hypothetical protein [Escherichia coli]
MRFGLSRGRERSSGEYRRQYPLARGFGGFTPVSYAAMLCRLPCRWRGISRPTETSGSECLSDPFYFAIE